ncbi:MAG TPA: CBS domain-containing protein [Solirubrobacterales bacterium]|nr:CBS domain-containing protein [Solirubrobacterales bacterium]
MERTYFGPAFKDAQVHNVMRVGVVTCRPQTKLADVARMMVGYDIHSIVVADVGAATPWGIVTSLDLARFPDELDSLTAGDIASRGLVTIKSDAPLEQAANLMAEHGISHLIAVQPDQEDRPAGMISARDLTLALAYGRS